MNKHFETIIIRQYVRHERLKLLSKGFYDSKGKDINKREFEDNETREELGK